MEDSQKTTKQNSTGSVTNQNVQPEKKKNNVLIVILIIVVICSVLFIALMGIGAWFIKSMILDDMTVEPVKQQVVKKQTLPSSNDNENINTKNIDVYEESGERNNMYYSAELGFSLPMQLGWEKFIMDEELLGGDFNIADVNFYLPSVQGKSEEFPGYVNMFTVSVYVTESWNDPMRDHSNDEMLGEVIGNNDYYTFVYSHFNGDIKDITPQTIQKMQKIIDDIETFDVASVAYDDSEFFTEKEINDAYALYRDESIHYWNCLHQYSLYYPLTWSNNGPTNMSDEAQFYGDGIDVRVKAYPFTGTLEEFAAQQKKKYGYSAVTDMRDQMHGGAHVLAYAYDDSYVTVLYWKEGNNVMELKENWKNLKGKSDVINNMIATLQLNEDNEHCVN